MFEQRLKAMEEFCADQMKEMAQLRKEIAAMLCEAKELEKRELAVISDLYCPRRQVVEKPRWKAPRTEETFEYLDF